MREYKIDRKTTVSEIVKQDYRTAAVFRRYGIAFCCGAQIPLELACELQGENPDTVVRDLERAVHNIQLPANLRFDDWDLDFLADYIIHVHHDYLRNALPVALSLLQDFAAGHAKKFDWLPDLVDRVNELSAEMLNHIRYEEEIIFPYIRQIAHAYTNGEVYAGLLVRTLSKPVESVMKQEQDFLNRTLGSIRGLTNDYALPANACTSHRVCFLTLWELDQDLVQHMHLENNILFPKAIAMEKELLARN